MHTWRIISVYSLMAIALSGCSSSTTTQATDEKGGSGAKRIPLPPVLGVGPRPVERRHSVGLVVVLLRKRAGPALHQSVARREPHSRMLAREGLSPLNPEARRLNLEARRLNPEARQPNQEERLAVALAAKVELPRVGSVQQELPERLPKVAPQLVAWLLAVPVAQQTLVAPQLGAWRTSTSVSWERIPATSTRPARILPLATNAPA